MSLENPHLRSTSANSIAMLKWVEGFICYKIVLINIFEQYNNRRHSKSELYVLIPVLSHDKYNIELMLGIYTKIFEHGYQLA